MRQYAAIALSLSILMGNGAAFAQHRDEGHDHDHGPRFEEHRDHDRDHREWREGYRMDRGDWDRGRHVDYRAYRLREPPRGYEWREVDGRFILGVIATGIIADIIINAR